MILSKFSVILHVDIVYGSCNVDDAEHTICFSGNDIYYIDGPPISDFYGKVILLWTTGLQKYFLITENKKLHPLDDIFDKNDIDYIIKHPTIAKKFDDLNILKAIVRL